MVIGLDGLKHRWRGFKEECRYKRRSRSCLSYVIFETTRGSGFTRSQRKQGFAGIIQGFERAASHSRSRLDHPENI